MLSMQRRLPLEAPPRSFSVQIRCDLSSRATSSFNAVGDPQTRVAKENMAAYRVVGFIVLAGLELAESELNRVLVIFKLSKTKEDERYFVLVGTRR